MKVFFSLEPNEKPSNIGIAKALIETDLKPSDLYEISRHLAVCCEAMSISDLTTPTHYIVKKEGAE